MYPVGAGEDADVIWNNRVAVAVNEISDLMGTASTSTGMGVTTRTDGGAQVTDNLIIYPNRYLHIRYAENADGSTQITDLSGYSGSTVFVGTFNSDSQNLAGTESFFYREFDWDNGTNNFYYNATGGGRVIFDVQSTSPGSGYTEQSTPLVGASALDLEAGIAQGQDGTSTFIIYASNANGASQSFDQETRNFIRFVSGTAQPTLPVTGTFTQITGDTGATGTAGSNGIAVQIVYASDAIGTGASTTQGSNTFIQYVTYPANQNAPTTFPTTGYVRFIGTDGDTGTTGTSGQSVAIFYADDANGDNSSTTQGSREFIRYVTFTAGGDAPTAPTSGYVRFVGIQGLPGNTGQSVRVVYASDANGTGASLTRGSLDFVQYEEFTGTAPTSFPTSGYVQFVGDDGGTGATGAAGQSVFPIYATDNAGAGRTLTPTDTTTFVTFYESTTAVTTANLAGLDLTGEVFVEYIGEDGAAGADARAVNVTITPNAVSQNADGTYTVQNLLVSAIFSAGIATPVTRNMGTITVATDGTTSFTIAPGATNTVTFDGVVHTPAATYTDSTHTIEVSLTAGVFTISDRESLTFGLAGSATTGDPGLPGVASIRTFNMRQDVVDAAGEYRLFNNTSGTVATDWSMVDRITIFVNNDILSLLTAVVNDQTHIRVRLDDDNWGYYEINQVPEVTGDTRTLSVTHQQSRGTITAATGATAEVGIGFDIAVAEIGDLPFALNLTVSPDSATQSQVTQAYNPGSGTVSYRLSQGTEVVSNNDTFATLTFNNDSTVTSSRDTNNDTTIMISETAFTLRYILSNNNRTIELQLLNSDGDILASDTHSVTLVETASLPRQDIAWADSLGEPEIQLVNSTGATTATTDQGRIDLAFSGNTGSDPMYASWRFTIPDSSLPTFNGAVQLDNGGSSSSPHITNSSGNIVMDSPINGSFEGLSTRTREDFFNSIAITLSIMLPGAGPSDVDRESSTVEVDSVAGTVTITRSTPGALSASDQAAIASAATYRYVADTRSLSLSAVVLNVGSGVAPVEQVGVIRLDSSFPTLIAAFTTANGTDSRMVVEISGDSELVGGHTRTLANFALSDAPGNYSEFYNPVATNQVWGSLLTIGDGGDLDVVGARSGRRDTIMTTLAWARINDFGAAIWVRRRDIRFYYTAGGQFFVTMRLESADGTVSQDLATLTSLDLAGDPLPTPSQMSVVIPSQNIREIIPFDYGLTSATDIRDAFNTAWTANATLNAVYTATTEGDNTRLLQAGTAGNAPTVCFTPVQRTGTLAVIAATGTITGGIPTGFMHSIVIDDQIVPPTTVALGSGLNQAALRTTMIEEINNLNNYVATLDGTTIRCVSRELAMDFPQITITVTSTDPLLTQALIVITTDQDGEEPVDVLYATAQGDIFVNPSPPADYIFRAERTVTDGSPPSTTFTDYTFIRL